MKLHQKNSSPGIGITDPGFTFRLSESSINKFCHDIGTDRLLVQGAGGNISWKDKNTMWIKASGTWLSESLVKNIFVPVQLDIIKESILNSDFEIRPTAIKGYKLKPSIETLMHAIIPKKIVLHLHAVDILSHLVREKDNIIDIFKNIVNINIVKIPYKKPGSKIANEIILNLKNKPNANVLFLKNHGVVIGSDDLYSLNKILHVIIDKMKSDLIHLDNEKIKINNNLTIGSKNIYYPIPDLELNHLVLDNNLYKRIKNDWCLYPDHIVFLGAKAFCYLNKNELITKINNTKFFPEIVFIKNLGIFYHNNISKAKLCQLRCYFDVIVRQKNNYKLRSLNSKEIREIIDWDAEDYRISLSK